MKGNFEEWLQNSRRGQDLKVRGQQSISHYFIHRRRCLPNENRNISEMNIGCSINQTLLTLLIVENQLRHRSLRVVRKIFVDETK